MAEGEDDDVQRRQEEWTALLSIYGEDSVVGGPDALEWKVSLGDRCGWLEVHLPHDYPSSSAPAPVILAPGMPEAQKEALAQELLALWDCAEVVYQWAEHLREAVPSLVLAGSLAQAELTDAASTAVAVATAAEAEEEAAARGGGFTFEPPTAKYGQRVRHFDSAALDPSHSVELTSGPAFHPSHGGPGETFRAHVAAVRSQAEVQWALCTLLQARCSPPPPPPPPCPPAPPPLPPPLAAWTTAASVTTITASSHLYWRQDKRIARATHNMIAYRFWDEARGVQAAPQPTAPRRDATHGHAPHPHHQHRHLLLLLGAAGSGQRR